MYFKYRSEFGIALSLFRDKVPCRDFSYNAGMIEAMDLAHL